MPTLNEKLEKTFEAATAGDGVTDVNLVEDDWVFSHPDGDVSYPKEGLDGSKDIIPEIHKAVKSVREQIAENQGE